MLQEDQYCVTFLVLKNTKPIYTIIALVTIIVLFLSFDSIVALIIQILPEANTSRTMMYFLNSQAAEDSGRLNIYKRVIEQVVDSPFAIRGINADYLLIGSYTHNIFIELLYEFGIIIGGFFCIDIMIKSIRSYFLMDRNDASSFCFLFTIMTIPQLIISHTFWAEWIFWAWLILCYKCSNKGIIGSLLRRNK